MNKTIFIFAFFVFSLLAVNTAHAALTEAQIQSILSLLTSFGADSNVVSNVEKSLRPPKFSSENLGGCNFSRDLFVGIRGDDVKCLQEYLNVSPQSGFFGPLTKAAVSLWQQASGISPASGYFGPISRAKFGELAAAKPAPEMEKTPALSPPISEPTPPVEEPPAPAVESPKVLKIGGGGETDFPAYALVSFKAGEFTVTNGTAQDAVFSQIVLNIEDSLNSPNNRGRGVIFVLGTGADYPASTISRTSFTFHSGPPASDNPHRHQLNLSFPETVTAGQTKTFGLWIDNLEYVISGSMKISFNSFLSTLPLDPQGGFTFTLKR